jgi:serine/threonine-protein kinase
MGEVYRARDTRLKRDVALKILPDLFVSDPERRARFEREAQVLAALNHPNIASIYGFAEGPADVSAADAVPALVLELVEGQTLAERLADARGSLPLDETLSIARQIAEALEAAHERGIIHRDLKPANVKITPQGTVKVLDFGLAAITEDAAQQSVDATQSPTMTLASRAGVILGTAAYMSPEQASGKPADKRSDIWSYGVVLWEMLTARRLFDGETIPHTLAFVLTTSPDWTALPATTPSPIRRLLMRCLERDRRKRLPDIGMARLEIDDALNPPVVQSQPVVAAPRDGRWQRAIPWAVAAVAFAAAVPALIYTAPWRSEPTATPVRLSAELGGNVSLRPFEGGASGADLALSPDGDVLVFVGESQAGRSMLYLRRLDRLEATPLSGTEDGRNPFFSPDGEWVGFFAGGVVKKVPVRGGTAITLAAAAPDARGGAWSEDGTIVFTPTGGPQTGLSKVSSEGGAAQPGVALQQGDNSYRWPQFLPGNVVLFSAGATPGGSWDDANIVAQRLPEGPRTIVHRGGHFARYVATGHIVFINGGTLFATPFDLERLQPTGQPVPVLDGIANSPGTGAAQFAISNSGTLVYLPGRSGGQEAPVAWLDRNGRTTPLRATPAPWSNPSFSPDGTRLAMDISSPGPHIWLYEWARDTLTKFTFEATSVKPVWTPDGSRVTFASTRAGTPVNNLFWQRADGTGDIQRLTETTLGHLPGSWHPSGRFLAFTEGNPTTAADIMILPMEGDEASGWKPGKPEVFVNTPANEIEPMFSPDGRWIAYTSQETGVAEIYVRPFRGPGGKRQVSTGGGVYAAWSRSELFFAAPNQQLMVASYTVAGDSFQSDKARPVGPPRAYLPRPRLRSYALHPDGNRFAVAPVPDTQTVARPDKVVVVLNFAEELKRATASAGR